MENFCYIDSISYKLKYFNRISMILSSICHVNVDHCQQRCHLQFTMVCADTEIGLGLDSENNNIRICITSGAAEIKKSQKRIFIFFRICPNLESAGLRNYLSKNSGLIHRIVYQINILLCGDLFTRSSIINHFIEHS